MINSLPRGGDVVGQRPRFAAEQALPGADGRHQQAQDHGEPSGMKQERCCDAKTQQRYCVDQPVFRPVGGHDLMVTTSVFQTLTGR